MENKFPNICRTCYEYKNDHLISLYETEEKENTTYKDMLRDCTSIEIFADDNLPSVICQQCVTILITAFKFKRDCSLNDQKFKAALEKKRSANANNTDVTNTIFTILEASQDNSSQDTSDDDRNKNETPGMVTNVCNNNSGIVESENIMLKDEILKKQDTTCKKGLNVDTELKCTLIKHVQKNHNLQKLPKPKKDIEGGHVCTYCGKSFRSAYDLTVHVRRHTGIKPYVCKICNMSFVSMGRLTSHSRMHTGETPFTCKICDKAFSHSSTLYRHVQSHKKQHVCEFCQKRFTFLSGLETHKRMHSGVKPHQCKTCGKGFTENKLLLRHLVVHEEDKPHLCNVCGKNFKRIATLNKHLKTQHRIGKKSENFVDDIAV